MLTKNCNWLTQNRSNTYPALFPRLSSVAQVNIEPWNPEFDCSWFVRMRDLGKIGVLSCNGTNGTSGDPNTGNGGSSTGPPTSPTSNGGSNTSSTGPKSGLTTAASAGIGVGVGVVALGIVATLAWLVIHYRRKLRDVAGEGHNNGRDDPKETVGEVPEPQGALIDGNQVHEGDGRSVPHQAGGAEVLEAGGAALRAEAGNERRDEDRVDEAAAPQQKRSPVELG